MPKWIYDGHPVVIGLAPDPRAWIGREHERPQPLVDAGHFAAFDAARSQAEWRSGDWTPVEKVKGELVIADIAAELAAELAEDTVDGK